MNQKEVLVISITIFFTVIAWIIADIVHVSNTRQVEITNTTVTHIISVTVDRDVISQLKQKK